MLAPSSNHCGDNDGDYDDDHQHHIGEESTEEGEQPSLSPRCRGRWGIWRQVRSQIQVVYNSKADI